MLGPFALVIGSSGVYFIEMSRDLPIFLFKSRFSDQVRHDADPIPARFSDSVITYFGRSIHDHSAEGYPFDDRLEVLAEEFLIRDDLRWRWRPFAFVPGGLQRGSSHLTHRSDFGNCRSSRMLSRIVL